MQYTVTWRLNAGVCSQKSTAEMESIAKQRLVETRFQHDQLEQSVAEQH
jgi:hypothetical protein